VKNIPELRQHALRTEPPMSLRFIGNYWCVFIHTPYMWSYMCVVHLSVVGFQIRSNLQHNYYKYLHIYMIIAKKNLVVRELKSYLIRSSHFSLFTVHCLLYTVLCTLFTVNCPLFTVHCTLHTAHCTLFTEHCSLFTVHSSLYNVHCLL
jgi:hypothetical protein